MSVWNKVLLVLIFLCAAAFVYLGADALKMRRDSQKKLVDAQKALEAEQEKKQKLYFGTGQDDSYLSLVNEVDRLRKFRGTRAWPNCMPFSQAVVNGTTVTLQLMVDALPKPTATQPEADAQLDDKQQAGTAQQPDDNQPDDFAAPDSPVTPPDPGTIDPNAPDPGGVSEPVTPAQDRVLPGTTVYLFDKRAIVDGGCLLGEFTVAKVDNNIATLTNVYQMTEAEVNRINDSVNATDASWAVYTVLPRTTVEIQVASSEANEPVTDTGEAVADDLEPENGPGEEETLVDDESRNAEDPAKFSVADSIPQQVPEILADPTNDPRPALAQTFASLNNKRRQLSNRIVMQKMQQDALATTQVKAMKMIEFYQKEIEDTQAQRQETLRQYGEVKKLYDVTEAEITKTKYLIASLKSLNKKMLADLTQAQLRASEIILERDASLSMTK